MDLFCNIGGIVIVYSWRLSKRKYGQHCHYSVINILDSPVPQNVADQMHQHSAKVIQVVYPMGGVLVVSELGCMNN